ncbi:ATP-binding protein [uncultured Ilyobacter sp.]|uniref:ATP-binding protein n=1 Tax=uncultured Ilyobacter sp. TaxID=544433 RepID=UPI0029F55319|nr:ATP-binding protein [uncultured Ilyobacter sp.]
MPWKRKNIENIFIVCVITIFMGQIYMSPFSSWFRFSIAGVVLPIALLFFSDIPILITCMVIGFFIPFFRAFVEFLNVSNISYIDAFYKYFPTIGYYVMYGLLFIALDIRNKKNKFSIFILSLWICDSTSNILELSIRNIWWDFPFKVAIFQAILVGFIRAFVVYLFYNFVLYVKNRYDKDKKDKEYKESLIFVSKLKTEVFFLKKSIDDIEHTMEKSYLLYDELKDAELKNYALEISRNIHEIKKDYFRVVTGIESTLETEMEERNFTMTLFDVLKIIEDSTKKFLNSVDKDIYIKFDVKKNIKLINYLPLISLINNLIINSIEAIDKNGVITIEGTTENKNLVITVTDNGPGIEKEDLKLIFQPGFSTKYDLISGKMSTGIGLSHVKNLVDEYYEGELYCDSIQNVFTSFTIKIPVTNLI